MLASVYSYRVMVKIISSCCVRERQVLSNPVTYIAYVGQVTISTYEIDHVPFIRCMIHRENVRILLRIYLLKVTKYGKL